jgi:hypothetical protein
MKTSIKGVLCASAAGLIVIGKAQAADLPVNAKAVEYVRICSPYGAGFSYVPGTDTCIKLGGYLRADVTFNGAGIQNIPAWDGNAGQHNRLRNQYIARSRQDFNIDTRTPTDYGVLRTYFESVMSWTTGTDGVASGSLGVYFAFIQFAGFTMGKVVSQFDVPWTAYPANITNGLLGGHSDDTGVNQFTYTASFGESVTAAISVQDQAAYYQTNLWNTSALTGATFATGALGASSYGGTVVPDIVGMVRVDQAWGLFQASVATHNIHAGYYDPAETSGHPGDKWGWAGQLGLSIRNIPTGPGDVINLTAGYADGASRYIWQSLDSTTLAMFGGTSLPGVYQSLGIAGASDGVFVGTSSAAGTPIETTRMWGFRGGYTHNWNAYWNSGIFGAYTGVSYGSAAKGYICAAVATLLTAGSSCNPDFNIAQVGANTRWTPVKDLTFTGEVLYSRLDQKYAGTVALPAVTTKPAALYELRDQDTWTFALRAQRNLVTSAVALAADRPGGLPEKARDAEHVRICTLYGVGFYYVAGTDTCVKLGGYLRADVTFNGSGIQNMPAWNGNTGQANRLRNNYLARSRGDLTIDTRTATDYGVLRTFFESTMSWTTGTDGIEGGSLGIYFAFIQFAGFTMGKTVSQFDTPWMGYPANIANGLIGGHSDDTGVNQFTYTADFGQGVTAAISLQDQVAYYQTNLWNVSGLTGAAFATGALGSNSYGGASAPDIVGMVRVDQAWGLFQASVAAHDIHAAYYGPLETSGHPGDKWGWAGQLGLSIKNIPTGPGDTINMSAGYADGTSRYIWNSLVATNLAMFGGTGIAGAYQSLGIAGASDGVFMGTSSATGTPIETTRMWGFRGGYTHNWNAYWNSAIFGAYTAVSYNGTAKGYLCGAVAGLLSPGSSCNPDFNIAQFGANTRWTPVQGLTFTAEVLYSSLDQKFAGTIALPAVATKPAALYELRDQSTWTFAVRVQRNW